MRVLVAQRALAAWAGTDRLPALDPARLATRPVTAASALLALFVAGVDVPAALAGPVEPELAERRGDLLHARVAILPTARGVVVCDRADAAGADPDLVCWPDDSSYHLARALPPGRRGAWLDLGCGSAFAPLERPELATAILATDVNARAVRYARLGARLSGVGHVDVALADLGAGLAGRFDLVTCNAPIPGGAGPRWRAADADFVARLVERAAALVAPGGLVVVHAALDALLPAVRALAGETIAVAYTPPTAPREFAVAWWEPAAPRRHVAARRALTPDRPHLDHTDRDDARAGTLPSL